MKKQSPIHNINLEQIIFNETKESVWNQILNFPEFKSLFIEEMEEFKINQQGKMIWNFFYFISIMGEYHIESYEKEKHLLIKISSDRFSSVLLITLDENRDHILLRIDHRSFFGAYASRYRKVFLNKWKKMLHFFKKTQKTKV